MTVYKIRNRAGLFSTGGSNPNWTKIGKTWVALNHLNAHLTLIRSGQERWKKYLTGTVWSEVQKSHMKDHALRMATIYDDCEVVAFEMKETKSQMIVQGRILVESQLADFHAVSGKGLKS